MLLTTHKLTCPKGAAIRFSMGAQPPRRGTGETGEGTLRVSFAGGGKNLMRGLERLREGLVRIGTQPGGRGARANGKHSISCPTMILTSYDFDQP